MNEFPNLPAGVTVEVINEKYIVKYKDQMMTTPLAEEVMKFAMSMIVFDRTCPDCE